MCNINKIIKEEANYLLHNLKLYSLLTKYIDTNNIYISGSYVLDVMAWRDLDIFIDIKNTSQTDVFNIVKDIMDIYKPVWVETRDTHNEESGCPKGYFIGFETYEVTSDLWNIDIWITDKEHIENHLGYIDNIKKELNDEKRKTIIDIKTQLISSGDYNNKYFSVDVYESVLKGKGELTKIIEKNK